MKILLIHTQHELQRYETGVYRKYLRYAPLTMATLAALVPEELGAEITVVDEMVEPVDLSLNPDIVGLTAITSVAPRAYELAAHFRAKGARVVLGGVHATLMTEEALQHADVVVRGYAERTWPQLLRDYAAGTLERVYESTDAETAQLIVEPDRSLIKRQHYAAKNTIEMSRGCSKRCSFCVTHLLNPSYITKDVDALIEHVRRLPGKVVTFLDPNVYGQPRYAREFFTKLIPLRKWWVGCVTIDLVKQPEILDLMVASGAKGFLIGFESLRQDALESINKGFSKVDDYMAAIDTIHRRGVAVQGNFILGFDSDDHTSFDEMADFVLRAPIDLPQFTVLTPFPGTRDFARLEAEGRLLHRDWQRYNGHEVVFRPAQMSPEELAAGVQHVWRRTYGYGGILRRMWGPPWLLKPVFLASNLNFRRFMKRAHLGMG